MEIAFSAVIGMSLGSFINACVYRLPRNIPVFAKRSCCPHCEAQLRWYELIPVLSYVVLRGRCGHCSERISPRYPVIELLSGFAAAGLLMQYGISVKLLSALGFVLLMLLIALIDWRHLIIPNIVLGAGFVVALAGRFFTAPESIPEGLATAAIVSIVLFLFIMSMSTILRKEAMGMGDVKLAALITFVLGSIHFFIALWVAAVLGAAYGGAKALFRAKQPHGEKVPFGSFLAFASVVIFLLSDLMNTWVELWLM